MTWKYNYKRDTPSYISAIKSLRPNIVKNNTQFHVNGKGEILFWEDWDNPPPTPQEVNEELDKQIELYEKYEYYRQRKENLPDPYELIWILYNDIKCGNIDKGSFISLLDEMVDRFPD